MADLDPPAVDTDDLTAAWADLEAWARTQTATLEGDISTAAAESATAEQAHRDATATLETADQAHAAGQTETAHTAAVRDATAADHARTTLTDRLSELQTLLDQAPPADALPGLLEECARLEAAMEAATAQASRTREAVKTAEAEQQLGRPAPSECTS